MQGLCTVAYERQEKLAQYRIFLEPVFGKYLVYPSQLLLNDATAADVQVSDLRVAHLAGRQAYAFAKGNQRCVRTGFEQTIESWGVRSVNCVSSGIRIEC